MCWCGCLCVCRDATRRRYVARSSASAGEINTKGPGAAPERAGKGSVIRRLIECVGCWLACFMQLARWCCRGCHTIMLRSPAACWRLVLSRRMQGGELGGKRKRAPNCSSLPNHSPKLGYRFVVLLAAHSPGISRHIDEKVSLVWPRGTDGSTPAEFRRNTAQTTPG